MLEEEGRGGEEREYLLLHELPWSLTTLEYSIMDAIRTSYTICSYISAKLT